MCNLKETLIVVMLSLLTGLPAEYMTGDQKVNGFFLSAFVKVQTKWKTVVYQVIILSTWNGDWISVWIQFNIIVFKQSVFGKCFL